MTINSMQHVLGSSLSLPAYGRVGQGQYFLLVAHFVLRNTKNSSEEKEEE